MCNFNTSKASTKYVSTYVRTYYLCGCIQCEACAQCRIHSDISCTYAQPLPTTSYSLV